MTLVVGQTLADKARAAAVEAAAKAAAAPAVEEKKPVIKMPVQIPKGMKAAESKGGATKTGGEMRGYKITADGRKTTFFNNDLDDEARALIGDIAPKKVIMIDARGEISKCLL